MLWLIVCACVTTSTFMCGKVVLPSKGVQGCVKDCSELNSTHLWIRNCSHHQHFVVIIVSA